MYLFLFLLMPLSFVAYCFVTGDKKIVPAAVIGFLAAVLVCGFKLIFLYAHRIVPYSFVNNFMFYLFRQSLLPVVILYGLFLLISRDSMEYKIKSYLPLLLCFYMAYLPYTIVSTGSSIIPGYILFVKPIVYLAMIFETSILLNFIYGFIKEKKYGLVAVGVILIMVYLVIPGLIESLYMVGTSFSVVILSSVIYCVLPSIYGIVKAVPAIR